MKQERITDSSIVINFSVWSNKLSTCQRTENELYHGIAGLLRTTKRIEHRYKAIYINISMKYVTNNVKIIFNKCEVSDVRTKARSISMRTMLQELKSVN